MEFLNKTNILPGCQIESISNKYSMPSSNFAANLNCSRQPRCQCNCFRCMGSK